MNSLAKLDSIAQTYKRIGIFGGTFDPVHNGHVAAACAAAHALCLDCVLFMPARISAFKQNQHTAPAQLRLEMCTKACEECVAITSRLASHEELTQKTDYLVSDFELLREGVSYTSSTLETLTQLFGKTVHLYFILGVDAAATLLSWNRPELLAAKAEFAVVERPKASLPDEKLQELVDFGFRITRIYEKTPDISSSELREAFTTHNVPEDYLPSGVYDIIAKNKLYGHEG